jgi:thiol-disulfide isomerase/thioredoxin
MKVLLLCLSLLAVAPPLPAARPAGDEAEARVLDYVRTHLEPGKPLIVSDLYNNVFTQPEERRALDKLYSAFFRIPLFVAQYQEKFGEAPSLKVIAQQFSRQSPQDADVLLRVMESDPRVPKFVTRDPKTGEISHVDVAAIKENPRFGQALERHLSGWEGKPSPQVSLQALGGQHVAVGCPGEKTTLLYVWFTGCPPCMKETPDLVKLDAELRARGLSIVGANADKVLGLSYDDSTRQRYAQELGIAFPIVNWTRESDVAFGNISIFPTLFLIDARGVIVRHWVGYTPLEELRQAVTSQFASAREPQKTEGSLN